MDRISRRALVEVHRGPEGDLVVVAATTAAEQLLAMPRGSLRGSDWGPQFVDADAASVRDGCDAVIDSRRQAWRGRVRAAARPERRIGVTVTRPVGTLRPRLRIELSEVADANTDGGTRTEMPQDQPSEQQLAHALLQSARDTATTHAVVATDLGGTITFFNPAAERLTGLSAEDVVGRASPIAFLDPEELADRADALGVAADYDVVLGDVRTGGSTRRRDWTYLHRSGSRVTVSVTASPMRDLAGAVFGYVTLAEDVSEARAAQRQLQAALAQERELVTRLSALDQAKSDFIAAVNHELRTPLTSILGYTDVLLDDSVGVLSPLQARMVARVDRNGRRLLKLVENLLTLSALQTGTLDLERRRVDLVGVVGDSVARAAADLKAGGLKVTLELGVVPSPVFGDETQLGRVVSSLIDNAIAFTPPGGRLRLTLGRDRGDAVLEVVDDGVGISTHEQSELFECFVRSSEAVAREAQGLGLGLAVVGSIVASHGGRVTLSSTPGVGTTVTVRLPCAEDGTIPSLGTVRHAVAS